MRTRKHDSPRLGGRGAVWGGGSGNCWGRCRACHARRARHNQMCGVISSLSPSLFLSGDGVSSSLSLSHTHKAVARQFSPRDGGGGVGSETSSLSLSLFRCSDRRGSLDESGTQQECHPRHAGARIDGHARDTSAFVRRNTGVPRSQENTPP